MNGKTLERNVDSFQKFRVGNFKIQSIVQGGAVKWPIFKNKL